MAGLSITLADGVESDLALEWGAADAAWLTRQSVGVCFVYEAWLLEKTD
jgi:hypothetical protein